MAALRAAYCVIHCLGLLLLAGLLVPAWAQVQTNITSDGSLGTTVTPNGNVFEITEGSQQGGNLFHSFDRFDVGSGDVARFSGPASVENILSRVTGGQQSLIDGTLKSDIAGANLYLLNPSGVMFGPNATLDVQGSFHVSTADVLRFEDGATFSADLGGKSMLTVAIPGAFGFLQTQPASISVDGSHLQVPGGQTLSLIGGNMEITGDADTTSSVSPTLTARGGHILLESVGSPSDVGISSSESFRNLQVEEFERLGRIIISDSAFISVTSVPEVESLLGPPIEGSVIIRGESLWVGKSVVASNSTVTIQVRDTLTIAAEGFIGVTGIGGELAGNILIEAATLMIAEGRIANLGFANDAGTVTVRVRDTLTITDHGLISSDRGARIIPVFGSAGHILIEAGVLTLSDGGQISSRSELNLGGGTVTVRVRDTLAITGVGPLPNSQSGIFTDTTISGSAGNILVEAGSFTLSSGGQISSNSELNLDSSGTVTVRVRDTLTITGVGPLPNSQSGIFADTSGNRGNSGLAANILVEAAVLTLSAGGRISSEGIGIGAVLGTSAGGEVRVRVSDTLMIIGSNPSGFSSGIFANTSGNGNGGNITINARQIQLADGGLIESSSTSLGNAGDITIAVQDTFISKNSAVRTDATQADGGNITLQGGNLIRLQNSEISARVGGGAETLGGNLTLNSAFTVIENSQVVADAPHSIGLSGKS